MNYRLFEASNNSLGLSIFAILLTAIVISAVVFSLAYKGRHGDKLVLGTIALLVAAVVGSIFLSAQHQANGNRTDLLNKQIATENILAKYDLKEVLWDVKDTTAEPMDTKGDNNIIVKTQNDVEYVFKYRADIQTGEPFLKDMPIPGGSAPKDAVNAASLLKAK